MDVGDCGQAEFGPALGWRRPGGTNRMFFSFVFRVFFFLCLTDMGRRGSGSPDMTLCSWDGTWFKGGKMVAAVRKGSGKPLPWLFGPRVAG